MYIYIYFNINNVYILWICLCIKLNSFLYINDFEIELNIQFKYEYSRPGSARVGMPCPAPAHVRPMYPPKFLPLLWTPPILRFKVVPLAPSITSPGLTRCLEQLKLCPVHKFSFAEALNLLHIETLRQRDHLRWVKQDLVDNNRLVLLIYNHSRTSCLNHHSRNRKMYQNCMFPSMKATTDDHSKLLSCWLILNLLRLCMHPLESERFKSVWIIFAYTKRSLTSRYGVFKQKNWQAWFAAELLQCLPSCIHFPLSLTHVALEAAAAYQLKNCDIVEVPRCSLSSPRSNHVTLESMMQKKNNLHGLSQADLKTGWLHHCLPERHVHIKLASHLKQVAVIGAKARRPRVAGQRSVGPDVRSPQLLWTDTKLWVLSSSTISIFELFSVQYFGVKSPCCWCFHVESWNRVVSCLTNVHASV